MTLSQWFAQCPLPKNEARLLLQHITGFTHAQTVTRSDFRLPENLLAALNVLVRRRTDGEPVAYLTGTREFYGRDFRVTPAVLIPRPENEHLLEAALARLPQGGTLWDLGTGSGIIAVTAKLERPDARVSAGDISAQALHVAQENARALGADITFAQGSWLAAAQGFRQPENGADVIVSNPPYIENGDTHLTQGDLRFEPLHALTDFADGLAHIRTIAADARPYLAQGGWLLLEHGFNQGKAVRDILSAHGFGAIETRQDLAGLDRVTLGQWHAV